MSTIERLPAPESPREHAGETLRLTEGMTVEQQQTVIRGVLEKFNGKPQLRNVLATGMFRAARAKVKQTQNAPIWEALEKEVQNPTAETLDRLMEVSLEQQLGFRINQADQYNVAPKAGGQVFDRVRDDLMRQIGQTTLNMLVEGLDAARAEIPTTPKEREQQTRTQMREHNQRIALITEGMEYLQTAGATQASTTGLAELSFTPEQIERAKE